MHGWQRAPIALPSKLVPEAGRGWGSAVLSPHRENTGRSVCPLQSAEGERSEEAEGR